MNEYLILTLHEITVCSGTESHIVLNPPKIITWLACPWLASSIAHFCQSSSCFNQLREKPSSNLLSWKMKAILKVPKTELHWRTTWGWLQTSILIKSHKKKKSLSAFQRKIFLQPYTKKKNPQVYIWSSRNLAKTSNKGNWLKLRWFPL